MKDYYGSRAKIGVFHPASCVVLEPEYWAMAPEGVSIHAARLYLAEGTVPTLTAVMEGDGVEKCTRELAESPLDVITFGGTSATFLEGIGYDEKVSARMAEVSKGIPVTTTSTALLRALRALGARRISFATPYIDEVTERGRIFLSDNGFEVLNSEGLGLKTDHTIGAVKTAEVYDFVRGMVRPEADAVCISCTGFRTVGALAPLEAELGIPVVSANQAAFWDCLRLAQVKDQVEGFGQLFAH